MLTLKRINLRNKTNLDKIFTFIKDNHSTPAALLPERSYYLNTKLRCYEVYNENNEFIGISCLKELSVGYYEIEKTIIDANFRGRGYGYALAEVMIKEGISLGAKKFLSVIYHFNLKMLTIRLKQGFLIEGLVRNVDGLGNHEYFLGREIDHE